MSIVNCTTGSSRGVPSGRVMIPSTPNVSGAARANGLSRMIATPKINDRSPSDVLFIRNEFIGKTEVLVEGAFYIEKM
ncbi:MAG: hypothetical protein IPM97_00475 [Bdellovibrionaceae bacterium]|nr:hypothetical protein [Pseudobdellovibrionaceae bacterium]